MREAVIMISSPRKVGAVAANTVSGNKPQRKKPQNISFKERAMCNVQCAMFPCHPNVEPGTLNVELFLIPIPPLTLLKI
jgi:hypothetical protein